MVYLQFYPTLALPTIVHLQQLQGIGVGRGRGGFSRGGTGARAPPAVTPSMGIYILFNNALITF